MEQISKLRKMSGAGMMDCKNALAETDGDFDKAMEIIRKKGQAVAAKRSDREASEGCVLATAKDGFAAIVAVKCETDFVAKNGDFVGMTQAILDAAMVAAPASVEALSEIEVSGRAVKDLITDRIGVTGEKMELGFYEFVNGASTISYIHPGNKLATVVAFNQAGVDNQVAKDVAMQVAAMSPVAVSKDGVAQSIIDKELQIAREKAQEAGKPEHMIDRIAEGGLNKFFKENTLLSQAFIKDSKITVEEYLKKQDKDLTVVDFKRITLNQE